MTMIETLLFIVALISVCLGLCWLDAKYHFRFIDWLNCNCDNPFERSKIANQCDMLSSSKQREIEQLNERIKVLEKIVTEPAYELDKKLNAL